ncbi:cytokine receptor-like factor 3 [Aplysia californica]|uniref:Cytokine receptor-like factor 3 n=1 Tax=Aplysia californica TaxID=6500 RepID=A0ABM0JTB9_APLCA|nr:cytokine receptor-like factor 3 [Aplysia californica]
MTAELIQSVVEIMDSAHNYRYELAEVNDELKYLQDQINVSSDAAHKQVETHFARLKNAVVSALDQRLADLKNDIENIRIDALKPLEECQALVNENLGSAAVVMDEGASILADNPEANCEKIVKFKENPKTKALSSVPAIPTPSEVACVNVVLSHDIEKYIESTVLSEGRILARAPVQISEVIEKPGGLLVNWSEIDEESDITEFWLQYASGNHKSSDSANAVYHTAYVGTSGCYLIKHLRTNSPYTLRVCGRGESDTPWSAWSIPKVASTAIEHYKWSPSESKAYCLSNEDKVATRTAEGVSHVLYSSEASFKQDNTLTIKILDDADKSPGDGLCISTKNSDVEFFGQEEIIFVNLYGSVYVNGQEMTMKLPEIRKGSIVAFQAELLPNGKVRVSVQHEDKELTFDWKIEVPPPSSAGPSMLLGMGAGEPAEDRLALYFGIKFSQEEWKIAVD